MSVHVKEIGILSMQRICNYGSFLQAYGLKKCIEKLGNKVVFVDYQVEPAFTSNQDERIKYKKLCFRKKIIDFIYWCKPFWRFYPESVKVSLYERKMYESFCYGQLNITSKRKYRTQVDTLVIGSDEVFNCFQMNPNVGYSKELFGYNAKANRIITYAASFGNTTLDLILEKNKRVEIAALLDCLNAVSARDTNTAHIIENLTQKEVVYNLDPVLIYDYSAEIPDVVTEKDYIVVYAYRGRLSDEEICTIKEFAHEKGKKIITIGGYYSFSDWHFQGTPFEVLDYFRHADYIFTDTFHGTIFSIINKKKFVTFVRDSFHGQYGNSEKLLDLLNRLKLRDRCVSDMRSVGETMENDIDYDSVFDIISRERVRALEFLAKNL